PFCNAVRPAFVFPAPQPTCLQGSDATYDPTINPTAANLGGCPREKAVYRSSMQNNDPIRRACATNEQVCSHSRTLGLVLSMNEPFIAVPQTNADRYSPSSCTRGVFTTGPIPEVFDAITQRKIPSSQGALCPNGDISPTGACVVPSVTVS